MSDKNYYFERLINSPYLDEFTFRVRKRIFKIFMEEINPLPNENIVDIGVFCGSDEPKMNFFEMLYKYPEKIVAAGIEDASFLEKQYNGLKFIRIAPNKALPFADNQFDVGFCSAVIEHVGSSDRQKYFLRETIRVCKKLFLTTPNRFYPLEIHTFVFFLHWLPDPFFRTVLKCLGLDFYSKEENLNLLSKRQLLALLPEQYLGKSRILHYKLFGITSNLILILEK